MHKFWMVVSAQQSNGLVAITRHDTYSAAHHMAAQKARQFPDTTFFVAEAQCAVLCPPAEVVTYDLRGAVREVA